MAISFTDWNNQELRHYGIPGMRKGVRREELLELRRRRMAQVQGGGQAQPAQNPSISREQVQQLRARAQQMRARRLEMMRRRAEAEARGGERRQSRGGRSRQQRRFGSAGRSEEETRRQ